MQLLDATKCCAVQRKSYSCSGSCTQCWNKAIKTTLELPHLVSSGLYIHGLKLLTEVERVLLRSTEFAFPLVGLLGGNMDAGMVLLLGRSLVPSSVPLIFRFRFGVWFCSLAEGFWIRCPASMVSILPLRNLNSSWGGLMLSSLRVSCIHASLSTLGRRWSNIVVMMASEVH